MNITDEDIAGKRVIPSKELEIADVDTQEKRERLPKTYDKGDQNCDFLRWRMHGRFCPNNISRFDGVKYGRRAENYKNIDELWQQKGLTFYSSYLAVLTYRTGTRIGYIQELPCRGGKVCGADESTMRFMPLPAKQVTSVDIYAAFGVRLRRKYIYLWQI